MIDHIWLRSAAQVLVPRARRPSRNPFDSIVSSPPPGSPHHKRTLNGWRYASNHPASSPVEGFYCLSPSGDETNWSRRLCISPPPPRGGCIFFFFHSVGNALDQHNTSVHHGWISSTSPLVRDWSWIGGCGLAGALPRRRQRAVPPKPCGEGAICHQHPAVRRRWRRPVAIRKKKAMVPAPTSSPSS